MSLYPFTIIAIHQLNEIDEKIAHMLMTNVFTFVTQELMISKIC